MRSVSRLFRSWEDHEKTRNSLRGRGTCTSHCSPWAPCDVMMHVGGQESSVNFCTRCEAELDLCVFCPVYTCALRPLLGKGPSLLHRGHRHVPSGRGSGTCNMVKTPCWVTPARHTKTDTACNSVNGKCERSQHRRVERGAGHGV